MPPSYPQDADKDSGLTRQGDPLNHDTASRRPRPSRASATEPSITARNAIRESLVGPGSPERATAILSKGAFYSLLRHHIGNIMMSRGDQTTASESHDVQELLDESSSDGCYVSFPSFENWDEGKEDESRDVFG